MAIKQRTSSGEVRNFLGKELPFSLEAEKAVLASLLLGIESPEEVIGRIEPADFYYKPNQIIFEAILDFNAQSKPFDLLILHDYLKNKKLLDEIGGSPYLLELQENLSAVGFLNEHAKIIKDKSLLRSLILSCAGVINKCFDFSGKDISEILDTAEKDIFKISHKIASKDFVSLSNLLTATFKKISEINISRGQVTGISTGFHKLDNMTSGFQNSDLIILAARPAMGKTALALNLAISAWNSGFEVGIFSLEMSSEQLVLRMIAAESGISHQKIRTGSIGSEEWLVLTETATLLAEAKIYIDDTPSISIMELRAKARRLKMKNNIKFLIIDYLQLITVDQKSENRTQEISSISRALKALSKELDIPILALSQLSRSLEARMDKRPMLSDLRESGSIEQDADLVCFIYRDIVYHPECDNPNSAEIIISKQRNGPTGVINALYDGSITKFFDSSEDQ